MGRFIIKHIKSMKPQINIKSYGNKEENNIEENKKVMTTDEKVALAQTVLGEKQTKRIKKDKGLIERTESSKIVLTEDNKELLND